MFDVLLVEDGGEPIGVVLRGVSRLAADAFAGAFNRRTDHDCRAVAGRSILVTHPVTHRAISTAFVALS